MDIWLAIGAVLPAVSLLDGLARARPVKSALHRRSIAGTALLWLIASAVYGVFLAAIGDPWASAALTIALAAVFTVVSNAKYAVLGEPLVFSDLTLAKSVFRHPQFYLDALSKVQAALIAAAMLLLPVLFGLLFRPDPQPHLIGLGIAAASVVALRMATAMAPWARLAPFPDLAGDVSRHGLAPVLLLYYLKWRRSPDTPAPLVPLTLPDAVRAGELVVIVQCESFADPADLFGAGAPVLPGLALARSRAVQCGNLLVSGFGAYTMRTEYGVLFGLDEAALGFRRFDPYQTALRDSAHALPTKLKGGDWHSIFVHPHDLRFYNRQQVFQRGGFDELIGPESFAEPVGRYVTDAAITTKLGQIIANRTGRTAIFAVTIENHGPWPTSGTEPVPQDYLNLLYQGDAMLADLMAILDQTGVAATLVFYGDHRPSIPGASVPGGDRYTPYVIVPFGQPRAEGAGHCTRRDLTPAQLHEAIVTLMITEEEAPFAAAASAAHGAEAPDRPIGSQ